MPREDDYSGLDTSDYGGTEGLDVPIDDDLYGTSDPETGADITVEDTSTWDPTHDETTGLAYPEGHVMTAAECTWIAATYDDAEIAKRLTVDQMRQCQRHGENMRPLGDPSNWKWYVGGALAAFVGLKIAKVI